MIGLIVEESKAKLKKIFLIVFWVIFDKSNPKEVAPEKNRKNKMKKMK